LIALHNVLFLYQVMPSETKCKGGWLVLYFDVVNCIQDFGFAQFFYLKYKQLSKMILRQTGRLKIQFLVLHEILLPLVLRIHCNIQIYLPSLTLTIWPSDAVFQQSRSENRINFLYF